MGYFFIYILLYTLLQYVVKMYNKKSYLAGVLASLHESSTEHVGGDLTWVGASAGAVAQDRSPQAHQTAGVVT